MSDSLRPHEPWHASLSITNSRSPPKPMSIKSVMTSNQLTLYHPLILLPSIFPSIRVFSSNSALHIRWPRYWNFSFNISPSNEHPGLISFRTDWLDLLTVQGTLKSLLQHLQLSNYRTSLRGFHCGSAGKESICNAGDLSSVPGLGRSPGEGNGYPLQYSCLENPMEHL